MTTTCKTLLERVRNRGDHDAWLQFYELYAPLIYRYARARGLTRADADEIRDQCLAVVGRKMQGFEYDRQKGQFKSWLYRIAHGKVVDHLRRRTPEARANTTALKAIPASQPTPDELWEQRWREQQLLYGLERARHRVSRQNYRAFHLLLVDHRSVPEVCESLGMNANQVYKAKMRVLAQIRAALSTIE